MNDVLIREWMPQDFEKIEEICRLTGQFIPFLGKSHYMRMIKRRRRRLDWLSGLELLVVEVNGQVVGVALAFRLLAMGSVALLAVHPEHQGRGIGSRLLDEACARLRKKMVRLAVILADSSAKAERRERLTEFYRRHRFRALWPIFIKGL